jgi:hypothetical protein
MRRILISLREMEYWSLNKASIEEALRMEKQMESEAISANQLRQLSKESGSKETCKLVLYKIKPLSLLVKLLMDLLQGKVE